MMKRTRLLALFFNLYSVSAVAGYECLLKLSHSEDLNKVVSEKTYRIEEGRMRGGSLGTLFVENAQNRKKVTLDINAVMSGWTGEEDATFVVFRSENKRRSIDTNVISEKMTVKGDDTQTFWFDAYKLDISCKVSDTVIDFD